MAMAARRRMAWEGTVPLPAIFSKRYRREPQLINECHASLAKQWKASQRLANVHEGHFERPGPLGPFGAARWQARLDAIAR
jgi:hypothetical protein